MSEERCFLLCSCHVFEGDRISKHASEVCMRVGNPHMQQGSYADALLLVLCYNSSRKGFVTNRFHLSCRPEILCNRFVAPVVLHDLLLCATWVQSAWSGSG